MAVAGCLFFMGRTIVVGAGICGLAAARACRGGGDEVLLLEAGEAPGGVIRSERRDGYLLERGPNTLALRAGHSTEYLEEIGLLDEVVDANPEANKRFLVRDGRPVAVPSSPTALLGSPLLSLCGKLRLLLEPFLPRGKNRANESVADFFRRRLGREALNYGANPFVAGVYAARPETLILRHAFPTIHELEGEHRSLMLGGMRAAKRRKKRGLPKTRLVSFREGLGELPHRLAKELGAAVRLKATVRKISREGEDWLLTYEKEGEVAEERAERLVCSIPAHRLNALEWENLGEAESLSILAAAPHHPVAVLYHGFRREDVGHALDGFGFLVPEKENLGILGTLFSSTLFPGRAPEGHVLLTTFVGGERQPDFARLEDDALHDLALKDLRGLLDVRADPSFRNLVRWPHAIPLPDSGQDARLAAAERLQAANPGLHLAGSHLTGASIPACLEGSDSMTFSHG